ncbi:group III truncated hemoglobin [Flavobacterium sp. N1719]|uniref:group III truncated hemoglobin n=1 Tax=Flavobacterium sp. N1719 TaxID=2885633 RepID=UPI002221B1B1|nr:group III truncated hemoglobin [Flavobacterium sp. N1719]
MTDIQTQEDIYRIVAEFYKKLFADERISYIFTDVIPVHEKLEEHLQILVKFWSQSLLGTGGYFNNLTQIHLDVDTLSALTKDHFDIWLSHFETAIDENFEGFTCERMKNMAHNLSTIMQIKIKQKNG